MDIKKQSTIFIRNFTKKFNTEESLKNGFKRFGSIENVFILQTPKRDVIGYVEYKDMESAIQAVDTADGLEMSDGKSMKVGIVKECNDSINNLYIKNVPESVDEGVLNSLFKKYGSIVSVTIMKNEEGNSRGFGFVCFQNEVHAAVAKRDMHGFEISGKKFDISFAQKKENREAYLTAQKKGILKVTEEPKKVTKLPLEKRIVRRPTKIELASYRSVPCLEQIPAYGNMNYWQCNRLISSSMMKMPTMAEVFLSSSPPNMFSQHQFMSNNINNKHLSGQKSVYNKTRANSSHNLTKSAAGKKTNPEPKPVEKPANEKSESATLPSQNPEKDKKDVLQDVILPQLQNMYPTYATEIMQRIMERQYKDVLRLARNYRLLHKVAGSEVQKIKAQNQGPKRAKN